MMLRSRDLGDHLFEEKDKMTMQTLARSREVRPGLKGTALWREGQGSLRNYNEFQIERREEKYHYILFLLLLNLESALP